MRRQEFAYAGIHGERYPLRERQRGPAADLGQAGVAYELLRGLDDRFYLAA
jgi:hypothetical protein